MKRKISLYLLGFTAILIGLAGCKKVEQTELKISDCKYSTTIMGTLYYPAGHSPEDDYQAIKPAAGRTIFIDVDYSYYRGDNEGFKRFSTTTNESGKFEITIPVRAKEGTAEINVASFKNDVNQPHWVPVYDESSSQWKYKAKNVIYYYNGTYTYLEPSKINNHNIMLQFQVTD